jgi:hypothetical protein
MFRSMMPLKSFLKIGFLLIFFSLFTWWSVRSLLSSNPPVTKEEKKSQEPRIVKSEPEAPKPVSMDRVRSFYANESKRIGAIDSNPALTEARLKEFSSSLSQEEIRWLIGEASDPTKNGDGRFFAVYLLALSKDEFAMRALTELAVSPIPMQKNKGLEELERQLRAQATEGLARACEANKELKDSLLDIIEKQGDEFLRDRSHRALFQCQTGKSIEEQDKEALEKLLKKKKAQK